MESKSFVKILRKVIREEVRSAVKEVLTEQTTVTNNGMNLSEIGNPTANKPKSKKQFTKNSILNDLLNETAATPATQEMTDWSTMNFKSEMANSFVPNATPNQPSGPLATKGINGEPVNMSNKSVATAVNAMTKDYSALMKAMDAKDKAKGKR